MHRKFRLGLTKSLVRSDGLDAEFEALRSGRNNPELFARLFGLVECFKLLWSFCGASANPFDRSFQGFEVPRIESRYTYIELQPYRDLHPSRLKVSKNSNGCTGFFVSKTS